MADSVDTAQPHGPLGFFWPISLLPLCLSLHMVATCGEALMSPTLLALTLQAEGWQMNAGVSHLCVLLGVHLVFFFFFMLAIAAHTYPVIL